MTAIATLQRFASDGLVYRAFDHAVVAAMGLVVAVPLWHTEGCLKELPDQSPVPWMELWAVLDIEPARMKAKVGGGNAGHNGLRSISAHEITKVIPTAITVMVAVWRKMLSRLFRERKP